MKLQSINKNTITVISLLSCLAFLSLGTSVSAEYASLPEESFSLSQDVISVSDGQEKSLSDFGQVLGERLAGVWQELRGVVDGTSRGSLLSSTSSSASAGQAIPVTAFVSSGVENYFSDVASNPHARYINLLAKEGIVLGNQGRFYPDNYLRLYDLIKMAVDLYRVKVGYSLTGEQGISLIGAFSGDDSLQSRYVATALHLGFLSHLEPLDFQRFVSSEDLNQVFANISYEFTGMLRPGEVESMPILTRGEAVERLVLSFDVTADGITPYSAGTPVQWTPFVDVVGHPNQSAISTLADLGIVSTTSTSFYPDNYLHRYDFVIILVNTLLAKQKKTLSPEYVSGFVSPFVDVSSSSYSPFVYYAYDKGLLDYLTVNKRGQNYFLPEQMISKHEVYTLISRAIGKQFSYDIQQADTQYMTRGELAQILVDLFDFTPPKPVESAVVSAEEGSGSLLDKLTLLLQIKELFAKL